jgi:hypothetical protein
MFPVKYELNVYVVHSAHTVYLCVPLVLAVNSDGLPKQH